MCFGKLVRAVKSNVYKAKIVLMSGDVTGKAIVPIVQEKPQEYVAYSLQATGEQRRARTPEELKTLMKDLRAIGVYPIVFDKSEYENLQSHPDDLKKLFREKMIEGLRGWISLVDSELSSTGVKFFMMPGNDDPLEVSDIIAESKYTINPEDKYYPLDEHHEMISLGYSNPTAWKTPREFSEEEIAKKIDEMASQVQNMKNCIFNLHVPPYDSLIDTAPLLDENLRPKATMGDLMRAPAGSKAVRSAIEKYQPMLGLHGHIHESSGEIKIGKTVCINPGSEYHAGILRAYLINLDEKGLKSYMRVEG